jgi:hypothetical protein
MKIKKHLLVPLAFFGCAVLGVAQQNKPSGPPRPPPPANDYSPQTWKEYSSTEGRFTVLFPGIPKETGETFESSIGNLRLHTVVYNSFVSYSVNYIDYPMNIENPAIVKSILDNARNGSLSEVAKEDPHVTKESDISVDGHLGRFLQVELKGDAVVRSKYVPVRNRMYVVSVGTPKGRPNVLGAENNYEKIATSFLDSFKIIQSIGADESEAWTEFSSTEGRFKILFPGTPLQSSMQMELSHGNSLIHVASYQSSIAYSVMYTDYSEALNDPIAIKKCLDDIRIGELKSAVAMGMSPKVLSETDISLDGYPGRFLVVEFSDNRIYRRKMVIVKSRIYIIVATAPKDDANTLTEKNSYEKLSMKFVNSFSLMAALATPTKSSRLRSVMAKPNNSLQVSAG